MLPAGIKPTIPASEWLQNTILVCAANGIDKENIKIHTTQVKIDFIKYESPM
jgi:hypothetical protein